MTSGGYQYDALDRPANHGPDPFTYAGTTSPDPVTIAARKYARDPSDDLLAVDTQGSVALTASNRHQDLTFLFNGFGDVLGTNTLDPSTVRDWLSGQSFADQYEFGLDVTRRLSQGLPLQ